MVHVVTLWLATADVATFPPYAPAGTAAPLSAARDTTRPLPVPEPAERLVTPDGAVSAAVSESFWAQ